MTARRLVQSCQYVHGCRLSGTIGSEEAKDLTFIDIKCKMVIGNKGAKIKTIGIEARKDMQEMFEAPVHLELWVKVKSGWADDERALRSLGYVDDL